MYKFKPNDKYVYIKNAETPVEWFINNFYRNFIANFEVTTQENFDEDKLNSIAEAIRLQYCNGFCWYFAHMLGDAFPDGHVCWAAPFGHFVFIDKDGIAYDASGRYDGEAFYFIPEEYVLDRVVEFKHLNLECDMKYSTKEELIEIIKKFCNETNQDYNKEVEEYFY